jgi:SagB-type dehydrogenase family enzyme
MTELVLGYHERTKHTLARYANGPETLDWDAQPDPWRRFTGSALRALPLVADGLPARWAQLHPPGAVAPAVLQRRHVAALLELSFGLAAWKRLGPDRWALRCNPSSGNLHPTEAYVLTRGVTGLDDALWHYAPREHALERRASARHADTTAPGLWIGLSSIQWREAWKYGERAFRYCQLDAGHALGALAYATAVLGWRTRVVAPFETDALAARLGLDRAADFGDAEREEAELLVEIGPSPQGTAPMADLHDWSGRANRLDARPMYRWPVIDEVARATRGAVAADATPLPPPPPAGPRSEERRVGKECRRLCRSRWSPYH